jgi:hypothetical protein
MTSRKQIYLLSIFAISFSVVALLYIMSAKAQKSQNLKTLEFYSYDFMPNSVPAPIEITNMKVKGKSVKFAEPFEADDDWLNGITFDIRNSGNKDIIFFEIDVAWKLLNDKADGFTGKIFFGRRPIPGRMAATALLSSGGATSVSYNDLHRAMAGLTRKNIVSDTRAAEVRIGTVIFSDDTSWSMGSLFVRDPKDDRRWVRPNQENEGKPQISEGGKVSPSNALSASGFGNCYSNSGNTEHLSCSLDDGLVPTPTPDPNATPPQIQSCVESGDCQAEKPSYVQADTGFGLITRRTDCYCVFTNILCKKPRI